MRKLFLLTGCVWTMLFTACDNTDYSDHSPFDNSAYLSVAETRNVESFTFNRRVTEQAKKFTAKLTYPVGVDVTVRLQINPSLADAYNAKNDTQYEVLPARHYKLTAEAVTIPAGKTTSSELSGPAVECHYYCHQSEKCICGCSRSRQGESDSRCGK